MGQTARRGFTRVEFAVIVGFLVLTAALVAPQFAAASNASLKDSLRWELGRANDSIWMYRKDSGSGPELGSGAGEFGWGELVTGGYLERAPYNTFVGSSRVDGYQGQLVPGVEPSSGDAGWGLFDGTVFAVGYDPTLNLLSVESGYLCRPAMSDRSGSK